MVRGYFQYLRPTSVVDGIADKSSTQCGYSGHRGSTDVKDTGGTCIAQCSNCTRTVKVYNTINIVGKRGNWT